MAQLDYACATYALAYPTPTSPTPDSLTAYCSYHAFRHEGLVRTHARVVEYARGRSNLPAGVNTSSRTCVQSSFWPAGHCPVYHVLHTTAFGSRRAKTGGPRSTYKGSRLGLMGTAQRSTGPPVASITGPSMQVLHVVIVEPGQQEKNSGTASLWPMGFGLMMEKKIPDGEVEMHGPNFLDGRFPRPAGPLLPVKISRFSIQPVARVALGAGQGAERQNGTNENRVESDSLGSFFLRKPSPAGVVNPCLAWLACHQAASIGIDMGSCTWACRGR